MDAVQVGREARVEPPAALVVCGAVAHVQIVVAILRAERHVVMVTQRVSWKHTVKKQSSWKLSKFHGSTPGK